MSRRTDRAEVAAWLRLHPEATHRDLMAQFGLCNTTARRWVKDLPKEAPPTIKLADPPPPPARKGAPAALMDESDRTRALTTVRNAYRVIHLIVSRTLGQVEHGPGGQIPSLDRDTSQALLNLQRVAAGMIDSHPGLLELAKGEEPGENLSEDDLAGILDGIVPTPG